MNFEVSVKMIMDRDKLFFNGNVFFVFRCFKRSLNKDNCIIHDHFYLMERFLGKRGGGGGGGIGKVRRRNQRCYNIQ